MRAIRRQKISVFSVWYCHSSVGKKWKVKKERLSVPDYKSGVWKGSERYSSRDSKTKAILVNPFHLIWSLYLAHMLLISSYESSWGSSKLLIWYSQSNQRGLISSLELIRFHRCYYHLKIDTSIPQWVPFLQPRNERHHLSSELIAYHFQEQICPTQHLSLFVPYSSQSFCFLHTANVTIILLYA